MDKEVVQMALIYLSVSASVYCAHNFMYSFLKASCSIEIHDFSMLDTLEVLRLIGGFFWTNLADRTNKHRIIAIINMVGYAVFLNLLQWAPWFMKAKELNIWTIIYRGLSIFFQCGIYPILDAVILEMLEKNGKSRKHYSKIRIASTLGHVLAHLAVISVSYIFSVKQKDEKVVLILTSFFVLVTSILIFFYFSDVEKKETKKNKFPLKIRIQRNLKYVREILTFSFILFNITGTLQGIYRNAMTSFLPAHLENIGMKNNSIRGLFILRCLPEIGMLWITPYIERFVSIYVMMLFGICFGVFRPLLYGFAELKNLGQTGIYSVCILNELTKGIFSALYGYGSSKMAKEFSTEKTKALAQGIQGGCYCGLAPFICGLMGYFILKYDLFEYRGNSLRGFFILTGLLGCFGIFILLVLINNRKKKEKMSIGSSKIYVAV
ncbi:MFS_1-like transporter [Hamiltosporidium magnivora]|uniref:MFS_1-like transporter n=3 Tax=Hamiltosporidium TaxID=1176354 RepID=A0A4Q9LA50_9MICR|nr:hypothetical protein LUQ84_000252 [Hamiltosporidium tvaerminnensis]TBU02559.1 MFS_1-like transporter [Hamiltosporidium magnivora]TBU04544.1 MFS_1-like transporter [Hamiltosporidium magnivora]TBU05192.1 putative MFS_1-like transporter [Hamiltosporidium magnivora]